MDRSIIKDFFKHPAGWFIAGACTVALIATALTLGYMVMNHRSTLENIPPPSLSLAPSETPSSNASIPFSQHNFESQTGADEPTPPLTGCYWQHQNGYPYAMAYPPANIPEILDDKPLVGYAVVWHFAQDEIVIKRHSDNYRLLQWPIAYYLADDSANRVLLEIQGLYEADGERIAGENVKQTCSHTLTQ